MPPRLTRCPECGKLFELKRGNPLCSACTAQQVRDDHVPAEIPLATVAFIPRAPTPPATPESLDSNGSTGAPCLRCRKTPAQTGCDFCLNCRLDLSRAFGVAADELLAKFATLEPEPTAVADSSVALVSTIRDKRSRGGPTLEELAPQRGQI